MKRVMAFGTFDRLHPWHLHYLSEAKKCGEFLIVVVARDTTVLCVKKKNPTQAEDERYQALLGIPFVDEVVFGSIGNPYHIIAKYRPDVLFFGYDQDSFNNEEMHKYLEDNKIYPKILLWSPFEPEKWKSSKL